MPVEVAVAGHDYGFRVVRHPALLPLLVGYLAQASQEVRGRSFGDQTVRVRVSAAYAGGLEAVLDETLAAGDAAAQAAGLASALVAFLESSPFPVPSLDRVRVELDALTTYLVWLRTAHFAGLFSTAAYEAEQARVRDLILRESADGRKPHLVRYLEEWQRLSAEIARRRPS